MTPIEEGAERLDTIRLGLIATRGAAEELARDLSPRLPGALRERVSAAVAWEVLSVVDAFASDPRLSAIDMIDRARERMQRERWHLAVCLTELPLRNGRRPVIADASAMHGVALVSLPALGAARLRRRALDTIVRLLDGLMAQRLGAEEAHFDEERRTSVGRRLAGIAAGSRRRDDDDLSFVASVIRGNFRLLVGMVAANRPWRLAMRMSRALAAALGAVAFGLLQSDVWDIADSLSALRLAALTVLSIGATVATLIIAHELWERAGDGGLRREQAILFNAATTITIVLGIMVLYVALFLIALTSAALTLASGPLAKSLGHPARLADYLALAWLMASLSTVGGALGGGLESDETVRQAAYGYHPDPEAERGAREAEQPG